MKKARLMIDLPSGRYRSKWVNTLSGRVDKAEDITYGGGAVTLVGPGFENDIALRIKRIRK